MEIAIRRIKELQLVTLGCVVVLHQVTEIVIQPLLVSGVPDPFLENGILPVLVAPQSFWSIACDQLVQWTVQCFYISLESESGTLCEPAHCNRQLIRDRGVGEHFTQRLQVILRERTIRWCFSC